MSPSPIADDPPPETTAPAVGTGTVDAAPRETSASAAADTPGAAPDDTDPPATSPPHHASTRRRSTNPTVVAAVTVVSVLVVVMAGLYLVRRDGPEPVTASGRAGARAGTPSGTASSSPPTSVATDPQFSGRGAVRDDFGRRGTELGNVPNGPAWKATRGTWAVNGSEASVTTTRPDELALATISAVGVNVRAQVTLPRAEPGAALAFRAIDAQNYWLASVDPPSGTVILYRVESGTPTRMGATGPAAIAPGVKVGVNTSGGTIEVLVNGAVVGTFEDPLPAGRSIGLGTAPNATGGANGATTFDDLQYRPQ